MTTLALNARPRARARVITAVLAVTVAFLVAYASVLRLLVWQWYTNDVYSYGFLIPCISGYVLWIKRGEIARSFSRPDFRDGVPVVVVGLAMLLLGRAGGFGVLQELSIVFTLAGVVALCFGLSTLRTVSLPLAYLLLALPVWDTLTNPLHRPFQLMTARIGEWLLGLLGVPAFRSGTLLQLPSVSLEVAKACSGVNYLISVVAIAIPYSYLCAFRFTRRTAIVSLAVLVAILSNGLRVAFIGALQYYGFSSPADLHGPNHVLQGMFVAVVGYAALFVGAWLLADRAPSTPPVVSASTTADKRPTSWSPLATAAALLCSAALLAPFCDPVPVPLAPSDWWPARIGEWQGGAAGVSSAVVRARHPDVEFSREYHSRPTGSAHVYVGYFAVQKEGRKVMGFGGASLPEAAIRLPLKTSSGKTVQVAEAEVSAAGGTMRYVIAWYDMAGAVAADAYTAKALTLWNSVAHRRSNGAVVVISFAPSPGIGKERARAAVRQLAADLLPAVQDFLWTER